MFVLSNAWRALTRSKGRTALTAFITLAVTFGTVAGLAIIQEDTNAHTTAYDQQKATLAIRPTAATWKKVSATDSASTKHYMTWTSYTEYATLVQSATNSLNFTVTETVPARVSGDLKALDGGSLGSASDDETGGQLIWRAFWTKDSAKASDLGTFEIVDGKDLSYNNQSSNPNTTGALVSEAFASANNLKVGDTLEVAAASDAKTTANEESETPVTDTWITTKVKADLLVTEEVKGMDINVSTTNGVVTLAGKLDSQVQVDKALAVAQGIKGVKSVDTKALKVKPAK